MAAAAHILENSNEKEVEELRKKILEQLKEKLYDKDYFETIEQLRSEYKNDKHSKEILGILNQIENDRIAKIINAIRQFKIYSNKEALNQQAKTQADLKEDKEIGTQISIQPVTQESQRIKRYILDKKNEFRLLYSAKQKFNEGLANCPELSEFNIIKDTEKLEDISLANFLSEKGVLVLHSDSFHDHRGYTVGRYSISQEGLTDTLQQITTLLDPDAKVSATQTVTDETTKKTQVLLKKLILSPLNFEGKVTLVLSHCHANFSSFLTTLQTTSTLTALDLGCSPEEDCLAIISALGKNSSIRTFYWPESIGPFNKPQGLLGTKIREKTVELLDRTRGDVVNKVDKLKRLKLEGDYIDLLNTFNALRNSGLARIEMTMVYEPPNSKPNASSSTNEKLFEEEMATQGTATQKPTAQKITDLHNTLISVKWEHNEKNDFFGAVITNFIQPMSSYSNITSLDFTGNFDISKLLTILAPLPLQNLTLDCSIPVLTPTAWNPLENWQTTLKSFFIRFKNRALIATAPSADNFCENLKKLGMLNTLSIGTEVFCDFSWRNEDENEEEKAKRNKEQQKLFKKGNNNFLAAINNLPLTTVKLIDLYFSNMISCSRWEEGLMVIKMLTNSFEKHPNIMDVEFLGHSRFQELDEITNDNIKKQTEKNTIRTSRWVKITPLIAFIRANRMSAIQHSILPLLPEIQALAGFKVVKHKNVATTAMVATTATNAMAVTSTTANAIASSTTTIPPMVFSNDASNLQNSNINNLNSLVSDNHTQTVYNPTAASTTSKFCCIQ